MFVKICGTTSLADAQLAVELGADALGFIFAPSQRRVTVAEAGAITRVLPAGVERVGVFTEPDADAIGGAVRGAGLTAVQMHWPYEREVVEALGEVLGGGLGEEVKLWQVVGFAVDPADEDAADREFTRRLRAAMVDPRVAVVLLDVIKGGASGGLGLALPWGRAASIVKTARMAAEQAGRERGFAPPKVVLAGGLRAENLREAVSMIGPWGLDVVSGVEQSPGRKSPERLRAFLAAAHAAS